MLGVLLELLLAPDEQRVVAADRAVQAVAVAADPRPHLRRSRTAARSRTSNSTDPAHALDHAQDLAPLGLERASLRA